MNRSTKLAGVASLVQGLLFLLVPINLLVLQSAIGFTSDNDWIDPIKIRANFLPLMVTPLIQLGLCAVVVLLVVALYDRLGATSPYLMRLSVIAAIVASGLLLLSASLEFYYRALPTLSTSSPTALAQYQGLILNIHKGVAEAVRLAGFFAFGWSTLLWSWAGIRSKMLSRSLCLTALLSAVLAILLPLIPLYVIITIVWSFWLGAVLLGQKQPSVDHRPA